MSNNDLYCNKCKSQHHPVECPLDRGGAMMNKQAIREAVEWFDERSVMNKVTRGAECSTIPIDAPETKLIVSIAQAYCDDKLVEKVVSPTRCGSCGNLVPCDALKSEPVSNDDIVWLDSLYDCINQTIIYERGLGLFKRGHLTAIRAIKVLLTGKAGKGE